MSCLLIGLAGDTLSPQESDWLTHPDMAGVVLFNRNIQDPEQLRTLTDRIRAVRSDLLICIDQEGGRVQRIKEPLTRLPPLRDMGHCLKTDHDLAHRAATAHAWLMAHEIRAMGVDLSFTPVLDIDGDSAVIGDRAFGSDSDSVIDLARTYLDGMHQAGMATCGKHFPGHGTVVADTHHDVAIDSRSADEIEHTDLIPFAVLADQMDAVMMAHVCYPKVCSQTAGYSSVWIQDWLRQRCQFEGRVFSDDLGMRAAEQAGGYPERIMASLEAGCDLLLICEPDAVQEAMQNLPAIDQTGSPQVSLQAVEYPQWEELMGHPKRELHQKTLMELANCHGQHPSRPRSV